MRQYEYKTYGEAAIHLSEGWYTEQQLLEHLKWFKNYRDKMEKEMKRTKKERPGFKVQKT